MVFEEPKVEFTKIDMTLATTTTSGNCSADVAYFIEWDPSIETCDGAQAPMNNCSTYVKPDGFVNG